MPSREFTRSKHQAQIAAWLLICCALIFAMIVLGGVTRLTRSGLSIVEWDPIMGTIPPLNESQWQQAFYKYQQYPEYQQLNRGMTLGDFKSIFWIEYAHRLLGRAIGFVFLLPFLYFLLRRRLERALVPKLMAMFVLGALQGLLGWLMVKSGLVDQPRVSPYRLTAHLAMAVLIYGYVLWVALGLLFPQIENKRAHLQPVRRFAFVITAAVCLMIASGGFVAGTKAGFAFNTFPLFNGRLIPEGVFALRPVWTNFFENIATVQLDHRLIAYMLCIVVPLFWLQMRQRALSLRVQLAGHVLLVALSVQIVVGIATLLLVVPIPLAAAHQAGALVVFTVALFINHALRAAPASRRARKTQVSAESRVHVHPE